MENIFDSLLNIYLDIKKQNFIVKVFNKRKLFKRIDKLRKIDITVDILLSFCKFYEENSIALKNSNIIDCKVSDISFMIILHCTDCDISVKYIDEHVHYIIYKLQEHSKTAKNTINTSFISFNDIILESDDNLANEIKGIMYTYLIDLMSLY